MAANYFSILIIVVSFRWLLGVDEEIDNRRRMGLGLVGRHRRAALVFRGYLHSTPVLYRRFAC